jgi:hypothetical protein
MPQGDLYKNASKEKVKAEHTEKSLKGTGRHRDLQERTIPAAARKKKSRVAGRESRAASIGRNKKA